MFDDALHSALLYVLHLLGVGFAHLVGGQGEAGAEAPPPLTSAHHHHHRPQSGHGQRHPQALALPSLGVLKKFRQFQIADIYYHWVWVESVHMNPAMSSLPNFVDGQSFEYYIPSILCNISQHISNILLL